MGMTWEILPVQMKNWTIGLDHKLLEEADKKINDKVLQAI